MQGPREGGTSQGLPCTWLVAHTTVCWGRAPHAHGHSAVTQSGPKGPKNSDRQQWPRHPPQRPQGPQGKCTSNWSGGTCYRLMCIPQIRRLKPNASVVCQEVMRGSVPLQRPGGPAPLWWLHPRPSRHQRALPQPQWPPRAATWLQGLHCSVWTRQGTPRCPPPPAPAIPSVSRGPALLFVGSVCALPARLPVLGSLSRLGAPAGPAHAEAGHPGCSWRRPCSVCCSDVSSSGLRPKAETHWER